MAKALSPPREFGFLLSDVARNLRKTVDHEAKALGMTRAQWSVLVRLQRQQGLQQAELASALDLAPITLARLVDHLEDMKFVERRPDLMIDGPIVSFSQPLRARFSQSLVGLVSGL